jgi:hemoglobin
MDETPIFERLGGREGVFQLVEKVIANHLCHPIVGRRFQNAPMGEEKLKEHASEFFCTGLSGVPTYEGRELAEAHRGMNISEEEFVAVIDDIIAAMEASAVGEREQGEVLRILWGMKPDVVRL